MRNLELSELLRAYGAAPLVYHATSYWSTYEKPVLQVLDSMDMTQMRSGRYPILSTFGFVDQIYSFHTNLPHMAGWKKIIVNGIHRYITANHALMPYSLLLKDLQDLALRHCDLSALSCGALPLTGLSMSPYGNPTDIFNINECQYSIQFLNYYLRYCFAQKHIHFQGNEIVVELGTGSGAQVEVLKKLYPGMTILCFDLPAQIYLAQIYLAEALGPDQVVATATTRSWTDLSNLTPGKVYCFGNWQFPLLREAKIDVFWNAASFGEMEPEIVQNYLSFVSDRASWIYLLQARAGKETSSELNPSKAFVKTSTRLADYQQFLPAYDMIEEEAVWQALRQLSASGGYFQGVWKRRVE